MARTPRENINNEPRDPKKRRAQTALIKTFALLVLGAVILALALILRPKEANSIPSCGERLSSDGYCANGIVCINGAWECQSGPPDAQVIPSYPGSTPEICNALDDDCENTPPEDHVCRHNVASMNFLVDKHGAIADEPQMNDVRRMSAYRAAIRERKADYDIERSAEHWGILCRIGTGYEEKHFELCDEMVYRARRNNALGSAFYRAHEFFGLTIHPVYGNNFSVAENEVYIGLEKNDEDVIRFLDTLLADR